MIFFVPKQSSTSKANRDDTEQITLQNFLQDTQLFFQLLRVLYSDMNTDRQLTAWKACCHITDTIFMYKYLFCVIQEYCRKHFTVSLPHQLNFQILLEKCISSLPAYSPAQILPSLCLHFLAFYLFFISRNHLEN